MDKQLTLFDFRSPEAAVSWGPIDDRVMGGVSSSSFLYEDSFGALFTGEVSMEHGGGFASVRSGHLNLDLSDYQGLAISFLGDGKSYKLSVTTEPRFDSVIYRALFNTKPGIWEELKIPFGRFVPTFRGEIVDEAPELASSHIVALGLLISQRQKGPFRLKVSFIKAYCD
jgi:monofunctional biosynthetic peptidoglycan transglycosylase